MPSPSRRRCLGDGKRHDAGEIVVLNAKNGRQRPRLRVFDHEEAGWRLDRIDDLGKRRLQLGRRAVGCQIGIHEAADIVGRQVVKRIRQLGMGKIAGHDDRLVE